MNQALHGLFFDAKPISQPDGFLFDALNINADKFKGSIANEEGFDSFITGIKVYDTTTVATSLPTGTTCTGSAVVDANRIVLFLCHTSTQDEIGILYNSGLYEKRLIADLNFSLDHPIQARAKIRNTEIIVSWVDDYNQPRICNIDNLPFDVQLATATYPLTPVDSDDLMLLNIWPNMNKAITTITAVQDSGGKLLSGVYRFFNYYEMEDGSKLGYSVPSRQAIITDNVSDTWHQNDGCEPGTQTTKSIDIRASNIDMRYDKIVFCVIKTVEEEVSIYEFARHNITATTSNIIYSGFETETAIAIADFYSTVAPYNSAKTVFTTNDNKLGVANMEGNTEIGYQKYANNIDVSLITKKTYHHVNRLIHENNSLYIYTNQSFMPNEVYALYIGFELTDGTKSYAYHIPGRVASPASNWGLTYNEDDLVSDILATVPFVDRPDHWLNTDNSIAPGEIKWFHTRNTGNLAGIMGYWENKNELYPDHEDWDVWSVDPSTGEGYDTLVSLRGTAIRHHKFLTMGQQYTGGNIVFSSPNNYWYNADELSSLMYGIKLRNVKIPNDIRDRIVNVNVFFAKRNIINSTVLGQSLLFFDTGSGDHVFTYYPFDMLKNIYTPVGTFISQEYTFTHKRYDMTIPGLGAPAFSNTKYDMFCPSGAFPPNPSSVSDNSPQYYIRKVKNLTYQPDVMILGGYHGARLHGNIDRIPTGNTTAEPDFTPVDPAVAPAWYLSTLQIYKEDTYQDFTSQELVLASTFSRGLIDASETSPDIYGGDVFNSDYGLRTIWSTSAPNYDEDNLRDPKSTHRALWFFPCMSNSNINLRYEEDDNASPDNYYYPKKWDKTTVPATTTSQADSGYDYLALEIEASPMIYEYDNTYSVEHTTHGFIPYPYRHVHITDFARRILISTPSNEEEEAESWREFLPNNYFDLASDSGEIINIESLGEEIIINTTRTLFKTVGDKSLKVDTVTVYLGSGELFALQPQEQVISEDGYAGCDSQWSCLKIPLGYVYCNQQKGKVFMYDTKLKEISSLGLTEWFRNNLPSKFKTAIYELSSEIDFNFDNPINSVGLLTEYDSKYNRIILAKRDYDFTDDYPWRGVITAVGDIGSQGIYYLDDGTNQIWYAGSSTLVQEFTGFQELRAANYLSDESWTLTFSLSTMEWKSFHSYNPVLMMKNDFNLLSIPGNSNAIYKHNVKDKYCMYYDGVKKESFIEFAIGMVQDYTNGQKLGLHKNKLFDSIFWNTEIFDSNGVNDYSNTFTKMLVYNENQCSGVITLNNDNIFTDDGTWNVSQFRDIVINYANQFITAEKGIETGTNSSLLTDNTKLVTSNIKDTKRWYQRYYFRGKYIIVRLIYSNSSQNEFLLHSYGGYVQKGYR